MSNLSKIAPAILGVFMAATSLSTAGEAAPDAVNSADIGGFFDQLTPRYDVNKSIQALDHQFQSVLFKILELDEAQNQDSHFHTQVYAPYSHDMRNIGGGYYEESLYHTGNLKVDSCTSLTMESFFSRYLDKIESYLKENPEIEKAFAPDSAALDTIQSGIEKLKRINNIERDRIFIRTWNHDFANHPCGFRVL